MTSIRTTSSLALTAALALSCGVFAEKSERESLRSQGGVAGQTCSCTGDFDNNGLINGADLGTLLGGWGGAQFDLTGDGIVDGADLGTILGAWGACAAPANDNCLDAIAVEIGDAVPFCTTNATELQQGVSGSCGSVATNIFNDVWFNFVPEGDGELTLSTCGADFDTIIAVYTSTIPGLNSCPPVDGGVGTASLIGCNDDSNLCATNSLQSRLTVDVIAGKSYKIRVGGFAGAAGSGTLNVSFKSVGAQCFDGILVNGQDNTVKTVTGTTVDNFVNEAPCGGGPSKGEWITYIPTCQNQDVKLSTCYPETDFDTVITVYRESISGGCTALEIVCVDDTQSQACLLDGLFRKSKADFLASAGETYHILVSRFNATKEGNYKLTIETNCFNP